MKINLFKNKEKTLEVIIITIFYKGINSYYINLILNYLLTHYIIIMNSWLRLINSQFYYLCFSSLFLSNFMNILNSYVRIFIFEICYCCDFIFCSIYMVILNSLYHARFEYLLFLNFQPLASFFQSLLDFKVVCFMVRILEWVELH